MASSDYINFNQKLSTFLHNKVVEKLKLSKMSALNPIFKKKKKNQKNQDNFCQSKMTFKSESQFYRLCIPPFFYFFSFKPNSLYLKLKFIYSEKSTKFCEISTLFLSYLVPVRWRFRKTLWTSQNIWTLILHNRSHATRYTEHAVLSVYISHTEESSGGYCRHIYDIYWKPTSARVKAI